VRQDIVEEFGQQRIGGRDSRRGERPEGEFPGPKVFVLEDFGSLTLQSQDAFRTASSIVRSPT
jgi:hypothetical protein